MNGAPTTGMLHGDATARTLGVVRAWVFFLWLADVLKDPLDGLATLPREVLEPMGLLRLVPEAVWELLLHADVLAAGRWLLAVVLLLVVLGVRPYRPIAIVACSLLTLVNGLIHGFTYLSHAELAPLAVAWVLAIFPAADGFALGRPKRPSPVSVQRLGLVTVTLVFCSTYAFVAIFRLSVGGIEIFLDGTILQYVSSRSAEPGWVSGGWGLLALEHRSLGLALQAGFPLVTLFELASPLCLFFPWLRRTWLLVMLVFHVLTWWLMQLLFLHNMLLIPALLVDWEGLLARAKRSVVA